MTLIGGSFSELPTSWNLSTPVFAAAIVALVLFGQGFRRLRRRGRTDLAGWDRLALFTAGVLLATLPLVSPLDATGDEYLISAHMLQHVLVGDAAPALILLALRGPLVFFIVPEYALRPLARLGALRSVLGFLLRPWVSLASWALVIGAWHIPAAYDFALSHRPVHELEHTSFLLVGLLAWSQLIDPARRGALSVTARIAFAGALFGLGQILSDVMLLTPHALYPVYAAEPERIFGLTPVKDQLFAGLVMMTEQMLTLGTCVVLLLRWPRRQRATSNAATART